MSPNPPKDRFRLNEPKRTIPGGTRRKSLRVDPSRVPEVVRRKRLNRILLAHDPDVAERNRGKITGDDLELLRRIAQEGALAGTPPVLRRNAITYLADRLTPENLNVLVDLARSGEDFYVRGAALAALGRTGLVAVVPILVEGLAAREPVEAAGAEQGIVALGGIIGVSAVRSAAGGERRKVALERLDRVLAKVAEVDRSSKRRTKRRRTTPDTSTR